MKDPLSETIIENTNHEERSMCKLKINQLQNELKTVALDWKLFRNMEECTCSTTFDAFNKKVNLNIYLRILFRINNLYFFSFSFSSLASLLVMWGSIMYKMHGCT